MSKKTKLMGLLAWTLVWTACTRQPELTTTTPPILPMPVSATYQEGNLDLKESALQIHPGNGDPASGIERLSTFLKDGIRDICKIRLKESETGNIRLILNEYAVLDEEGYLLQVDTTGVCLEARCEAGLFYGIQTLLQMVGKDGKIRHCDIRDYPAFSYRGLHLDVSRHFMSVDYIKRQLDLMAKYKLNRFHWHLVDGGGWRFESENYPLLTQKGQARMGTDWLEWRNGGEIFVETGTPGSYGGYYTQEELKEVVAYAAERYITVIPEIEMPGHSNEVFYAYPELTCQGKPGSWEFCIGNPEVFTFLFNILDEIMEIFPSPYIHIGGDEARKKDWKACPACQALMEKEGLVEVEELQSWCIHKVEAYLNSKGRNIIGWDEILQGGLAPHATVMSWRGEAGGKEAARMRHQVIMTPGTPLYFDHYQSNPKTERHAIGGYNPLEWVYAYHPLPEDLSEEDHEYILGAQANLWTEYVHDEKEAEYMTWPRALALAEVVWTPVEKKNYPDFLLRANLHTRQMLDQGIHAFPLKNVVVTCQVDTVRQTALLEFSKENLLADIRYTTDGRKPDRRSPIYSGSLEVPAETIIAFRPFVGRKPAGETAWIRPEANAKRGFIYLDEKELN